jgi:hypothetical protein
LDGGRIENWKAERTWWGKKVSAEQKDSLSRRRYRVPEIPKQVIERYLTTKAGRSIHIEAPERAERRQRSPHGNRVQFSISQSLDYRTGFDQTTQPTRNLQTRC